jgi:S-adenosylmethionine:tRNA ribosyltransferase-isomerase
MIKSSKPLKAGQSILLNTGVELKVAQPLAGGRALMEFPVTSPSLEEFLWEHGRPPLPPYIKTGPHNLDRDKKRYQTVYSKIAGSVAAPTAGFHFSENLMSALEERGVEIVEITLHVGPGTFLPIRASRLSAHRMEKEYVPPLGEAYGRIERARAMGKRIIAVGSTSMRTLESLGALDDKVIKERGFWTDLFIRPGFQFKLTSGLITNFHLPASTLLALVCAFGGYDLIMRAYEEAIKLRYRFYSYGDACLII